MKFKQKFLRKSQFSREMNARAAQVQGMDNSPAAIEERMRQYIAEQLRSDEPDPLWMRVFEPAYFYVLSPLDIDDDAPYFEVLRATNSRLVDLVRLARRPFLPLEEAPEVLALYSGRNTDVLYQVVQDQGFFPGNDPQRSVLNWGHLSLVSRYLIGEGKEQLHPSRFQRVPETELTRKILEQDNGYLTRFRNTKGVYGPKNNTVSHSPSAHDL